MRQLMVLTLIATLGASLSFGETLVHPRNLKEEAKVLENAKKRWMWSTVALVAASFADVHSSWGKSESNSLLRSQNGTFGAKGLGIKMGIVGGVLVGQYLVVEKNPRLANVMTYGNFGMAAVKTGVAARNYTIEKPKYLLRQE